MALARVVGLLFSKMIRLCLRTSAHESIVRADCKTRVSEWLQPHIDYYYYSLSQPIRNRHHNSIISSTHEAIIHFSRGKLWYSIV